LHSSRRTIVLLLAARAWAQTPPDPSQVDKVFAAFDKPGAPGCALAVIRDGKIVYKHGYGMADLDHDLPITPASVFHVASISKQFTAASIVLLAEDGKLALDDAVRKHLPEVPDFGTPVTIRHLLNHTSGMRDQWAFLGLAGWRQNLDLITDGDVMGFVTRQKALNFPPGQMYMYSNTGFTVLAQIVQRVSGKSLREFTSERIFKPLGMTSTHFRDDHAEIVKNMAYGYNQQGNGPFRLSIPNFDTVGATSLLTTVEDLAKWDENFYQDFAHRGITAKMLTRGVLNNGEKIDYALGLQHGQYRGLPIVEHGGADAGYRANLLRFPEQHFSVACECNVAQANPSLLSRQVADLYLAGKLQPVKEAPKPSGLALPPSDMEAIAGMYWRASDMELREVQVRNGKLRYVGNAIVSEDLAALGDGKFHGPTTSSDLEIRGGRLVEVRGKQREEFPFVSKAVTLSPDDLAEFAGVYRLEEMDSEWTIAVDKTRLSISRLRAPTTGMVPQLQDVFVFRLGPGGGIMRFTRGADRKIDGFVLKSGRIRNVRFRRL
jgi:CubicO group peptidase (beta-lactamase class C family)